MDSSRLLSLRAVASTWLEAPPVFFLTCAGAAENRGHFKLCDIVRLTGKMTISCLGLIRVEQVGSVGVFVTQGK